MRYLPKIYIASSLFAHLLANNFLSVPPNVVHSVSPIFYAVALQCFHHGSPPPHDFRNSDGDIPVRCLKYFPNADWLWKFKS